MRLSSDAPAAKVLLGPVNPYTGKALPAAKPKTPAKTISWLPKTTATTPLVFPRPSAKPVAKPVSKPTVRPVTKPVAKPVVKVTPPSAGTHVTSTVTSSAPKSVTSAPATTAQKNAAAAATGLPADDRWNGLTQYEVSEIIKRAKNGVAVELNPQIADIKNQAKISQDRFNSDQALAQQTTNRTVAEQKELYDRLGVSLNALKPQIQQNYDDAAGKVAGNYSALQQALASRYGAAQSGTENELNRLGLQAAAPQATAQMGSDKAFFSSLADNNAAQAQGSIGADKASAVQNLLNSVQNAGASGTRLTATTLQDALAQSNADRANQTDIMNSLLSKASTLESTRRGMEYEQSNALQDQARSQKAAAQQQRFDNAIAEGNLDVKNSLAGTDATYKSALGNAAQTNAAAAQTRATAAANEAQVRAAATKAGVDYKGLDLALRTSAAAFAQNTKNYGTGINGALGYLSAKAGNTVVKGTNQSAYTIATNMFNDIVNNVHSVTDFKSAAADVQKRQKTNNYPQALINTINNALSMYYSAPAPKPKK